MENKKEEIQVIIYLNGRENGSFHCDYRGEDFVGECGCNVFTKLSKNKYKCNSCKSIYTAE